MIVKFTNGDRYVDAADTFETHSNVVQKNEEKPAGARPKWSGNIKVVSLTKLSDLKLEDETVVGIDEGQFFPDLVEQCDLLASKGYVVVVAALDATSDRKPFGGVCDLVPKSEHVKKLQAVCMHCHDMLSASFTWRLKPDNNIISVNCGKIIGIFELEEYFKNILLI